MAANSAVIGLLRVLLSANTAEFETAMKQSADQAKAWSRDLKQVGQQATAVGAALTKTLTVPLAGIGLSASKLAIDFESSFAGVRKTVDATEPQFAELAQGFRDLAKTIPVNVNDLNRLGEAAGALGIPRDKVVEFAAVMAKLGVSTNLTADQAADAIARIQNIFGAAGKDTERLASTLVALGNAGASTEKEIVEMGQRIAGAGHTVGLSQAQVLAFASTLASVGINAEAGGSAISRVFLKINDAVQKGGGNLAEFARVAGMSTAQFKEAFETNAASATQKFIEGLERLKQRGENINATIEGLTGKNIILKDTLFRLAGAGSLLNDQLKIADEAWQSNTALSKEAGERFKTTESRLLLLGNRVKDVGITLGNALRPAIDAAIRGMNALVPLLEKLAGTFASLPGGVQLTIVALGGVLAAAGPVVYVLGQLAIAGSAITAAFAANGFAMKALVGLRTELLALNVAAAGPALPLVALAAAIAGIRLATGSWTETLKVLAVPFYGTIQLIGDLLSNLIPTEGVIADVASIIKDALVIGVRELNRVLGVLWDWLTKIPAAIGIVARALRDELLREIDFVIERFGRLLPNSLKITLTALAVAANAIPGAFDSTKAAIHSAAEAMDRLANSGSTASTWTSTYSNFLTRGLVPAVGAATAGTKDHTGATDDNTKAGEKNIAVTSRQTQVKELQAKAEKHAASALEFETAAWERWEQVVSKALSNIPKAILTSGPSALDPNQIYTPKSIFDMEPRNDQLGPIALDPSKINMGDWAKGIPDTQRQSFWSNLFGSPQMVGQQLAGTIIGAFQGGGSAVASAAGQLGSSIGANIANFVKADGTKLFTGALGSIFAGALPVVGSLLGPLVNKIWGSLFGTEGRDTKLGLAKQFFGSVEDMQKEMVAHLSASEYNRLWKEFSEVGQNNKKQAEAAVQAIVAALELQKKKEAEVAAAAAESAQMQKDAIDEITNKYKTQLDEIDSRYKTLSDSVAKEAEEEHMGLTETLEREEMKRLETKRKALEAERDAEIEAKKETFKDTLDEAKTLDNELRTLFGKGYKIPLEFDFPKGIPSPGSLPAGYTGGATSGWEGRTPPAALTRPSGGGVAQFYADGKLLASMVVPNIPGEVKRLGLNK